MLADLLAVLFPHISCWFLRFEGRPSLTLALFAHRVLTESSRTILAMLLSCALDLLCAKTLVLVDLKVPQRLSGRFGVCILHAQALSLAESLSLRTTSWLVWRSTVAR